MKPFAILTHAVRGTSAVKVALVPAITLVERGLFLVPPVLVGRMIDFVVEGEIARVSFSLVLLVALGLLQALSWPLKQRYVSWVIQSIVLERSKAVTAEVLGKEFELFAPSRVGYVTKVVDRAVVGFETVLTVLLTQALPAVASVLLVAGYFVVLLPVGAPLLIVGAAVYLAVSGNILKWRRRFLDEVNDAEDESADAFAAVFLAGGAVKTSGAVDSVLGFLTRTYGKYAVKATRLSFASGVLVLAQSVTTLAITVLAISGGIRWMNMRVGFSAGDFAVVFSYVGVFMTNLGAAWGTRSALDEYEADQRAFSKIQSRDALPTVIRHEVATREPTLHLETVGGGSMGMLDVPVPISVNFGQTVGLIGSSGAGKTTLLQYAAGIRASREQVRIAGVEVAELTQSQRAQLAGYSWQVPQFLFGDWEEAVFFRKLKADELEEAHRLCGELGISEFFLPGKPDFRADTLSGGEKTRLNLLRVLVSPRPILLLDEPTSELDGESSRAVCSILARLSGKHTIIVATHDEQVRGICDRVFSVEGGVLVEIAGAKAPQALGLPPTTSGPLDGPIPDP